MKPIILTITILIISVLRPLVTFADHITVQGDVSGEWDTDTVRVIGDLTVPDGESLLIQPGTIVEFQGDFAFHIAGAVSALGLVNDSIFFQVADTAGFSVDTIPDGGWRGIRFDHNRNSNDTSVFSHCRFSFGKMVSDDPLTGNGGAVNVKAYNKVRISQCLFQDNFASYNGGAIGLDSADIAIHNSVFIRNRCGLAVAPWGYGGAISSDNSNPDIRWNVFNSNSSTGIGGALSVRYKDCNVYNNDFTGNFSALGGALGMLHIPEINYRINTNFFTENTALYFGGGVANINASPIYINNTIANNSATYGGGFYCKDSISPDFYNTIIWGNTAAVGPQGYLFEVYSQADFFYCDIEGGPSLFGGSGGGEAFFGAFEQCLDEYPDFLGFGRLPFSIYVNSPCFNAGSQDTTGFMLPSTDLEYNPRVVLEVIDIGADEVYPFDLEEKGESDDPVRVWPNPFRDRIWIELYNEKNEQVVAEIFDLTGRKISTLETGNMVEGSNVIQCKINSSTDQVYILKVTTCKQVFFRKLYNISH